MITVSDLQAHLAAYGWEPFSVEDNLVTATFLTEDEVASYLVVMQLEENWLRISIPNLLPPLEEQTWPYVTQLALQLSDVTRQARFAWADDDTLYICSDVYVENGLSYEQFEVALDTICFLAENAAPRLLAVHNGLPDPGEVEPAE